MYVSIDVNVVTNGRRALQLVAVMRCLACLLSIPGLVYSSQDLAFAAMRTATERLQCGFMVEGARGGSQLDSTL